MHRISIAGTILVFDLASAQFSHSRTVTPWAEYEAKLVSRMMSVRPFGVTVKRMARDFDGGGFAMWGLISGNSHGARVALTHKVYAEKLDKQVQIWLTDEPASLTSLLGAERAKFGRILEAWSKSTAEILRNLAAEIHESRRNLRVRRPKRGPRF